MSLLLFLALFLFKFVLFVDSKVPCDPESFQFVDSPRRVEKNGEYEFRIANGQEIGCAINVTYEWTLYRRHGRDLMKIPGDTEALKYPGKSKSMVNIIYMDKIPTEAGKVAKHFVLKVTLIPDPTHFPSYRLWYFGLDVQTANTITISGGRERTHWMDGHPLWLNTTGIEYGEAALANFSNPTWECSPPFYGAKPPTTFKWAIPEFRLIENVTYTCTVTVDLPSGEKESATQVIHIRSYAGIPRIEIKCIENCEQHGSNAYKVTTLQFICHDYCNGKENWTVVPFAQKYIEELTFLKEPKNAVRFKGHTFKPDSTMNFIATLGEATANLTIHYRMQQPKLAILCIENCNFINFKEIKFRVKCSAECDNLDYIWESQPKPRVPWIAKDDLLTLQPNSFALRPWATTPEVALQVRALTGKADFKFTPDLGPEPAMQLKCVKNCDPSNPHDATEFRATCHGETCESLSHFEWFLKPIPTQFHWIDHVTDGNKTLTIPPETFKNNDVLDLIIYGGTKETQIYRADLNGTKFVSQPTKITLLCEENCKPSSPYKAVLLRVNCMAGCDYGSYNYWLEPAPADFNYTAYHVSEKGTLLTIPANLYREGDKVSVMVSLADGSFTYEVDYEPTPPSLELWCVKNCIQPSDPMKDTVLEVECLQNCQNKLFEWLPIKDIWYEHMELGLNNRTITYKAGTFKDLDNIEFSVKTQNLEEPVQLILDYADPIADLVIKCQINCERSWTSLTTVLAIKCFANCQHLAYEWTITPEPDNFKWAKNMPLSSDNKTLTIMPFTFKDKDKITFKVTIFEVLSSKGNENHKYRETKQTTELQVEFEELLEVLVLMCAPMGCNTKGNRLEEVEFSVKCVKHCEGTTYNWELDPLPNGFDWDLHSVRGIENTTLKLRPGAAQDGDNITITVSRGAGKSSGYVVFKDPEPELQIICDENCVTSDPKKPVLLRVQCLSLCEYIQFYEYQWYLIPKAASHSHLGPKHESFKITEQSYKDGDIVNVTVKWRKARDLLMLTYIEPIPVLGIFCLRNCQYNPKKPTSFEVRCKANCLNSMTYEWITTPSSKAPASYFHHNEGLTFPENSYEAYDSLNLTVVSGKGYASESIIFMPSEASLTLHCTENCDTQLKADPRNPTAFKVTCESNCDNVDYEWLLDQPPIRFHSKTDLTISKERNWMKIRANLYKNDTLVRVYIKSGRSNSSLDIYFYAPLPVILVQCVENCGFSDPYAELKVKVACLQHCDHVKYSWTVTPHPATFTWSKNIQLYGDNETLVVIGDTYQDEDQALFIVQSGGATAELLVIFTVLPPVIEISCKPLCDRADPLEALEVRVDCIKFCHNPVYLWGLKPTLPGFAWHLNVTESPDNTSITILANSFVEDSKVNAVVVSNKSAYAMVQIHYLLQDPEMALVCKANCEFQPWHRIIFEVICKKNCKHFQFNCTFSPESHSPDPISWRPEKGMFSINAEKYREKDVVTIRCKSRNTTVKTVIRFRFDYTDTECNISPPKGISGVTEYLIDCHHLRENVTYRLFQRIDSFRGTFGVLLWYGTHGHMPDLWLAPGYKGRRTYLSVVVGHSWDVEAVYGFRVGVSDYPEGGEWNVVKYRLLSNRLNDFQRLIRDQQYPRVIQLASVLDSSLENCPPLFEIHYRRHLLEGISSVMNKIEPTQVMHLMTKMLTKDYSHSLATYHLITEIVSTSIDRLSKWNQSFPIYSQDEFYNITGEALFLVGTVIQHCKTAPGFKEGDFIKEEDYLSNVDYIENAGSRRHLKYLTNDIVRIVDAVSDMVTYAEERVSIRSPRIFTQTVHFSSFFREFRLENKNNRSAIIVSPLGSNDPRLKPTPALNVTMKIGYFEDNPFWWDPIIGSVKADFLFFGMRVNETRLKYATFDVQVHKAERGRWPKGTLEGFVNDVAKFTVYEFKVAEHSTLEMRVGGEDIIVSVANWYPTLEAIMKYGIHIKASDPIYYFSEIKTVYVGIAGKGAFTLQFASIQCFTWHGDFWNWDTQDCRAKEPQPKESRLVSCKCSRLSVFTANKSIPLYTLKPPRVEKYLEGTLKKFWYVTTTTAVVLIVSILAMTIAHLRDRKIKRSYKLHNLKDNVKTDPVMYLVAVQTGIWKNSGTTARVAVQVVGRNSVSRVHVLNGKNPTVLQRNSANCFVLYTPTYLGKVTALRVWHDSSGSRPHWYCSTIIVRDVCTRKRYIFVICRWFSLVYGQGSIKGTFYPKKRNVPACLGTRLEETLRMQHNYLGLLTERAIPNSTKQYAAISSISVLITMLTLLLLVPTHGTNDFWGTLQSLFIAAIISVIGSTILDILLRKSA